MVMKLEGRDFFFFFLTLKRWEREREREMSKRIKREELLYGSEYE